MFFPSTFERVFYDVGPPIVLVRILHLLHSAEGVFIFFFLSDMSRKNILSYP